MKGKVKWYNVKQGWGFIEGEDGQDIFVHKNDIPFWTIFLNKGDKIEYKKKETKRGLKAVGLQVL